MFVSPCKKVFSFLLIVLLSFQLTACNADTNSPADGSVPSVLSAEEIYAFASECTVEITADLPYATSVGTGFFENSTGTVITNYHVVEGAERAYITTADGLQYTVDGIIGYSSELDVAILDTSCTSSSALQRRTDSAITGETIYALGSSLGLTSTFSDGIISSAERLLNGNTYIQITAPISHGNSGGPLLDANGSVIGITSAAIVEGQNLNLAIPIEKIDSISRNANLSMDEFYEQTNPAEQLKQYLLDTGESTYTEGAFTTHNLSDLKMLELTYYGDLDISSLGQHALAFGIITEFMSSQGAPLQLYTCIRLQPNTGECYVFSNIVDQLIDVATYSGHQYITASASQVHASDVAYDIMLSIDSSDGTYDSEEFLLITQQSILEIIAYTNEWFATSGFTFTMSNFGF